MGRSRCRPALWVLTVQRANCCDWTCEPWLPFDGVLTTVTDAADGAPSAWRLNGTTYVSRRFDRTCLDQVLVFSHEAGNTCAGTAAGPDAVVHFGALATSLGGDALDPRPRWRSVDNLPSAANGVRLYQFACPNGPGAATAMINRTCERLRGGGTRTTKRILLQPCSSRAGEWFHVQVNVAAFFINIWLRTPPLAFPSPSKPEASKLLP